MENKKIKLVIWDADETLWNGSAYYTDKEAIKIKSGTKETLKELDKRGIINVLCSKNNYSDIDEMLKKFGIEKYFKELQIGWGLKSDAIKKIVKDFGFSFNEMLFIDDDSFQIAEVKSQIPDLNMISLSDPIDVFNINGIKVKNETDEDRRRIQIIKDDRNRNEAERNNRIDYKEFLCQCNIKMLIREIKENDWERVVQLLNRTNELNATVNRYTLKELEKSYKDNNEKILVVELIDKFGEYGLIAESIIDVKNSDIWFIKDITVSCRTMGRGIGSTLVLAILNLAKKENIKKVYGYVKLTESNWRMQSLFEKRGFKKIFDDGKIKRYEFDLNNKIMKYPKWLKIKSEL